MMFGEGNQQIPIQAKPDKLCEHHQNWNMQLLRNSTRKTNCPSKLLLIKITSISLIENPGPLTMQKHIFPANWFLFQFGFEFMSIFVEFVTRFSRLFGSCWHLLLWDDTIINCFECTLLDVSGLDNPLKYFPHKSQISIWNNCLCKAGYFNVLASHFKLKPLKTSEGPNFAASYWEMAQLVAAAMELFR